MLDVDTPPPSVLAPCVVTPFEPVATLAVLMLKVATPPRRVSAPRMGEPS
jgi:hypothetical protein